METLSPISSKVTESVCFDVLSNDVRGKGLFYFIALLFRPGISKVVEIGFLRVETKLRGNFFSSCALFIK